MDSLNLRSEGMSLVQERILGAVCPPEIDLSAFRGRCRFFRNFPYKVGPLPAINGVMGPL